MLRQMDLIRRYIEALDRQPGEEGGFWFFSVLALCFEDVLKSCVIALRLGIVPFKLNDVVVLGLRDFIQYRLVMN